VTMPDHPKRRPDFEAQHRPHRTFPIFDCRVLRHAGEIRDYSVLSPRELAALAAAYDPEAIACDVMIERLAVACLAPVGWREVWEGAALTARIAAQCCRARLRTRRGRQA
jgi:hypothetical protein